MMLFSRLAALSVLSILCSSTALGQGYPSKPVHIIVSFTAGSATDILARTYGQKLSEMWSQSVVVETGLTGFDYSPWVGMFAPAGTPPEVVDKIARDVRTTPQSPDVKECFTTLGAEAMPMTPQEFTKFVQTEIDESAKVIKAAGIKAQ